MNNWIQSTPERRRLRPQRGRLAGNSFPMLLMLAVVLLWSLARADAQIGPPILAPIPPQTVLGGSNVTAQAYGSDTNIPPRQVIYSLDAGGPSAAMINTNTGQFTWQTTLAPAGRAYTNLIVRVTIFGPTLSTAQPFIVTVTSNAPVANTPGFGPISGQTVNAGTMLQFYTYATNTDNSTNFIRFTLDPSSPTNATLTNYLSTIITNATSTNGYFVGNFTWTPDLSQVGPHPMKAIATEPATSLSATQDFSVNVILTNNCSQYTQFLAAVAEGGYVPLTNCPTLVLSNTITIATNVFLDAVSGSVTIAGNNLLRLFTVLPGASLTLNGVTLQGGSSDRGGAIYNSGTVVLSNCVVAGNNAVGASGINGTDGDSDPNYGKHGSDASPGQAGIGGAVFNLGTLIANSCQFTNNSAKGGTGGNGGNGSSGSYRGGNGGHGGDGAFGFGGAIYSAGTYLSLSNNCVFFGNTATGGSGGSGGTNGTGAFSGYAGTGGAGAEGSGAAVYCANSAVMLNCDFVNNTAQGGNSAPSGEAGGGYGVK